MADNYLELFGWLWIHLISNSLSFDFVERLQQKKDTFLNQLQYENPSIKLKSNLLAYFSNDLTSFST